MELNKILVWFTTGGAVVAISWLAEQIPAFQTLSPKAKQWVQFVGASVLALLAWAANKYVPPEVFAELAEPFGIVASIFVAVVINQVAYKIYKAADF